MAKLTKEQIEEFKQEEKESDDSSGYMYLAEEVAEAGDKEWALKLYKKAEELAENKDDYESLAESVVDDDYLGDKKWARDLYKKAEELAEEMDDYEDLADSIEDYLGDEEWAEEIRKFDTRTNSDGVIVAKNFDNGTSQAQGNEVCIGGLNQDQISEIAGLLKKGTYLESDYFQSFSNYDELYPGNGILICETDDIYNASDKDNHSKGKWEFLEGEEDISDVIVKNDLYLVTCRVETVYFHAQLPTESKDIPTNKTIELTALLDRINPMKNIPWDYLWEKCSEPPWFLFRGV